MHAYINKSITDSSSTPSNLKAKLNEEFNFDDFDPCPLNNPPPWINGIELDWANCTFVNPSYSKLNTTEKHGLGWVEKAHIEACKGKTIVMLLPARTDSHWFHDIILEHNYEVRFIKGRLKFGTGILHAAPFPSIIVIFKI